MVSGFFTSPYDHEWIMSGDARPMRMASKSSTWPCCFKSLSKSFISVHRSISWFSTRYREARTSVLLQFDVDGQRTNLLDQYVEGLRHAGFHAMVAVHDVLVHLGATDGVVRLHRQHLLQGVGGAVRLERPDFHLAEALAAELRLASQRLLGDERVRSGGTRVHLVVHQVVQLQHVHVTDRDRALEGLAGAAVVERGLAGLRQAGELQEVLDLLLRRTVEHRRGDRHAGAQVLRQRGDLRVAEGGT